MTLRRLPDQSHIDKVEFWNDKCVAHGSEFNGYSQWSTVRRFKAISRKMDKQSRVAELFAGAGNFELYEGPFNFYLACDWAEKPLALSRADRKVKYDITKDFETALSACAEEKIDWIVLCGGFMMRHIGENVDPVSILKKCFDVAKIGVVANFQSDQIAYPPGHECFGHNPLELLQQLTPLRVSLDQGYLPHEFLITLEHPQKDWR